MSDESKHEQQELSSKSRRLHQFPVFQPGLVYMNGDIGKLPRGAGYPANLEALATVSAVAPTQPLDYSVMNGAAAASELMLETGVVSGLEPVPQIAIGMGGAVGYAPIEMAPLNEMPPPTQMGEHAGSNIPLEQLKQMLSSQLEYYFSRENLANDAYLLSQMDNDQYVPIWTVANFNQVKKLTKDIKLITEVLRESPNVQVDEEGQKVRPNHKRCIVILREIPDNTPLDEVKNLFSGEGCPKCISCEFAHNNSWYVTFESDEDAQAAYRFLREVVKEFQGKPIMARIKAKPMHLPVPPSVPTVSGIKNGYRTPTAPPVYDPNAFPPGQQRFIYTNGTTMPQTTMQPYPGQVHVYHPQFYHTGMMPWGHASPAYFDMGVFAMNGALAPHNTYKPHNTRFNQRSRNKQRNGSDRNSGGGSGGGVSLVDGGGNMVPIARTSHPPLSGGPVTIGVAAPSLPNTMPNSKPMSSSYSTGTKFQSSHAPNVVGATDAQYASAGSSSHSNKGSQKFMLHKANESQSQEPTTMQYPRHRTHRRTKDQDGLSKTNNNSASGGVGSGNNTASGSGSGSSSSGASGPIANSLSSTRDSTSQNSGSSSGGASGASSSVHSGPNSNSTQHNRGVQFDLEATAFPPLPGLDSNSAGSKSHSESSDSAQQNRLSDVVKGTAKLKSSTTKDKDQPALPATQPQQQQNQQSQPTTTSSSPQHQQSSNYHAPPHHSHHPHHGNHHHYHQTTFNVINQSSTRSTSPAQPQQQQPLQQQQQHSQRVASSADHSVAVSSSGTTLTSPTTAPANTNSPANNNGDSDVALGTVTLTPPTSPDKSKTTETDESSTSATSTTTVTTNTSLLTPSTTVSCSSTTTMPTVTPRMFVRNTVMIDLDAARRRSSDLFTNMTASRRSAPEVQIHQMRGVSRRFHWTSRGRAMPK
ncbi:la-related protein CG11505 isoform X2 [Trichogramma pretiosum]|uniref:la-related protein CG11505 isoform X2 n=1 Tax=Trichogramma pretiosum TaxID=7493 RepID=UPI0006C98401|nr:la-related protein CG11505 isoform X2 [Trichogramma pretiosum]